MLLAVSQCIGLTAFCQTPSMLASPSQSGDNQSQADQGLFEFKPGQVAWNTTAKSPSCNTPQSPAEATAPGYSRVFKAPCLDPQIFAMNAENRMTAPPMPGGKWPRAKAIPIPTEWPNAKFEPIPTEWPNLKVVPIAGLSASPKPAK